MSIRHCQDNLCFLLPLWVKYSHRDLWGRLDILRRARGFLFKKPPFYRKQPCLTMPLYTLSNIYITLEGGGGRVSIIQYTPTSCLFCNLFYTPWHRASLPEISTFQKKLIRTSRERGKILQPPPLRIERRIERKEKRKRNRALNNQTRNRFSVGQTRIDRVATRLKVDFVDRRWISDSRANCINLQMSHRRGCCTYIDTSSLSIVLFFYIQPPFDAVCE